MQLEACLETEHVNTDEVTNGQSAFFGNVREISSERTLPGTPTARPR